MDLCEIKLDKFVVHKFVDKYISAMFFIQILCSLAKMPIIGLYQ